MDKIYLQSTATMDFDHPLVQAFYQSHGGKSRSKVQKAINLYGAVRDSIFYTPYDVSLELDHLKASYTLQQKKGFCVLKSVLLAALCRAAGIPARLGFADVKNHFSTEKILQAMKTDIFVFHGYTEIYLNNKWVKATPAFNKSLCDKLGVKPLEFDGEHDSLFQEYEGGKKYMEYLNDRGSYADVPVAEMIKTFKEYYPDLLVGKRLQLSERG